MKIISSNTQSDYRDSGSKFYGFLFYCKDETQFNERLQELKSEYSDASHHCYGYRVEPLGIREFSSDDGEPSGTAGLPILNQLKSAELINCGLVVIRYFGGTKLGKAGLINAYGESAQRAIADAITRNIVTAQRFRIKYSYSEELLFSNLEKQFNLKEVNAEYTDTISKVIACPRGKILEFKKYHKTIKHRGFELEELDNTFITN